MYVTVYSNTKSMPVCQVFALKPAPEFAQPLPLAFLVEPTSSYYFLFNSYALFSKTKVIELIE